MNFGTVGGAISKTESAEFCMDRRKPLEEYLAASYPFFVMPDVDGGYVITFSDLPGCVTKAERFEQIGPRAEEARSLWLRTVYTEEIEAPLPSGPEEYSGRFNLRLPRSLHQWLAEAAGAEGISLKQYVATVLARGDSQARIERQLAEIGRSRSQMQHQRTVEDLIAEGDRVVALVTVRGTLRKFVLPMVGQIGTEHLLFGLIREENGVAAKVLTNLGV